MTWLALLTEASDVRKHVWLSHAYINIIKPTSNNWPVQLVEMTTTQVKLRLIPDFSMSTTRWVAQAVTKNKDVSRSIGKVGVSNDSTEASDWACELWRQPASCSNTSIFWKLLATCCQECYCDTPMQTKDTISVPRYCRFKVIPQILSKTLCLKSININNRRWCRYQSH